MSQALSLFSAREDPPVLFFFPPFVYVFILKFFHTRAVCAATYAIMANSVSYYAFIWLFVFEGILSVSNMFWSTNSLIGTKFLDNPVGFFGLRLASVVKFMTKIPAHE